MPSVRLHHLVLLYLSVAYETDQHFDPLERQAVIQLAAQWVPSLSPEQIEEVVDAAFSAARSGHGVEVEELAGEVGHMLTPEQRRRVLTDLGQIARADGYLTTDEASTISRIRTLWGSLEQHRPDL